MLAKDPAFREQVKDSAATAINDAIEDPVKKEQPVPEALSAINDLYKDKGLQLCLYSVAELDRWMVIVKMDGSAAGAGEDDPSSYLDRYWKAIQPVAAMVPDEQLPQFLEVAGLLLIDPDVRARFISGDLHLADRGYTFSPEIEEALRAAVATVDDV